MATFTLLVALLSLSVALAAYSRAGRASGGGEDAAREARRAAAQVESTLRAELDVTRRLIAEVVRGVALTPEAILDGQLWRDVDAAEAAELIASGDVTLIDVRTPAETGSGVIPGAKLIPLDELEARKNEVPRAGRVLVYCAMGGRSAAACDGLAREGWSGLMNLNGGIGAWSGPIERR